MGISVKVCLGCVSFLDLLPTVGGIIPKARELDSMVYREDGAQVGVYTPLLSVLDHDVI